MRLWQEVQEVPRSLIQEPARAKVEHSPLPWRARPVEVFKPLSELPGAVFLDSSDSSYGERSQWSFLSACPKATIRFDDDQLTVSGDAGIDRSGCERLDPFEALQSFVRACEGDDARSNEVHSVPLTSMSIGYIGYEMGRFIECLPPRPRPPIAHPEMWFGYYPTALAYRHSDGSWWLRGPEDHGHEIDLSEVLLNASIDSGNGNGTVVASPEMRGQPTVIPNASDYLADVEQILERIRAGDFYQANLTRQVEAVFKSVDPIGLYMSLRRSNPAPFAAALKLDDVGPWILSSSPERFLHVKNREVETRPIKGTAPRDRDLDMDRTNRGMLMGSSKDAAELSMIVDVLRNDLGRVCDYGSVRLDEHRCLETYARVHHLVSTVTGRLREGNDAIDLLRATFPGGSITGAPKIKAMECLAELEPFGRGVYTGTIGYFDSNGDMDFSIAIRTMVLSGDRASFGIGGGVVADSEPEAEREETLYKGSAMMDALGVNGLQWASRT